SLWILHPPLDESGELKIIDEGKRAGEPDFGASGFIYDKHILLRSWFALRRRNAIDVPGEVEEIIEKIYGGHAQEDNVTEHERELIQITRESYLKALANEKQKAKVRYINHPYFEGELADLMLTPREEDSP